MGLFTRQSKDYFIKNLETQYISIGMFILSEGSICFELNGFELNKLDLFIKYLKNPEIYLLKNAKTYSYDFDIGVNKENFTFEFYNEQNKNIVDININNFNNKGIKLSLSNTQSQCFYIISNVDGGIIEKQKIDSFSKIFDTSYFDDGVYYMGININSQKVKKIVLKY